MPPRLRAEGRRLPEEVGGATAGSDSMDDVLLMVMVVVGASGLGG